MHFQLISHADEGLTSQLSIQAVITADAGVWPGLLAGSSHQLRGNLGACLDLAWKSEVM